MELTENEILKRKAELMLDEPVVIKITIDPKNWREKLLMKLRLKRSMYVYKVRGATIGTMIKISKVLLDIDYDEKPAEGEGQLTWGYQTIFDNAELCAEIIAIAIHNQRTDPPPIIKELIIDQFTAKQLKNTVLNVIGKMDVFVFTDTITLIRQMTVLKGEEKKVSPIDAGEKIAPTTDQISGEQLETLSSIFGSVMIP